MDTSAFFDYPDQQPGEQAEAEVLLARWSDDDWAKLLAYTSVRRARANEVVIQEGESERAIYFVTAGTLEILVGSGTGRRGRRLSLVKTGSVVGEFAFFDARPRSATARALTDCELLRLGNDAFDVFAAREPILARDLLFDLGRIMSLRLRQANAIIRQWLR